MKIMLKILKMMRDTLRQYANIISHIGTKMGFILRGTFLDSTIKNDLIK